MKNKMALYGNDSTNDIKIYGKCFKGAHCLFKYFSERN